MFHCFLSTAISLHFVILLHFLTSSSRFNCDLSLSCGLAVSLLSLIVGPPSSTSSDTFVLCKMFVSDCVKHGKGIFHEGQFIVQLVQVKTFTFMMFYS